MKTIKYAKDLYRTVGLRLGVIALLSTTAMAPALAQAEDLQCRATGLDGATKSGELDQSTPIEQLQAMVVRLAENSPHEFCQRNLLLRYLAANKVVLPTCNGPVKDLENLAHMQRLIQQQKDPKKDSSSWHLSLLPTLPERQASVEAFMDQATAKELFKIRISAAIPSADREQMYARIRARIDGQGYTDVVDDFYNLARVKGFCSFEKLLDEDVCTKALTFIGDRYIPRGNADVMDRELWKRVIGFDYYEKGILAAADLIANRPVPSPGDVFTDIKTAFVKAGYPAAHAEQAAWDILGVSSNHGPNTGHYLALFAEEGKEKQLISQRTIAISYIAASMTYNDYRNLAVGLPMYSYPNSIITACDSAKPYHFWMAAYMAHEMHSRFGFTVEEAAAGAFLAEKGYQIKRDAASHGTQGHAVDNVFLYQPYAPVHQVIRIDMAYAATGAHFGAEYVSGKPSRALNVTAALVALLRDGSNSSVGKIDYRAPGVAGFMDRIFSGGGSILSSYLRWKETFSADSAFKALNAN